MNKSTALTEKGEQDTVLVQRILEQDDHQAFEELYKHYREALYYTMYKMTGNKQDSEDLTMLAFEKAYLNLKNYNPRYCFSTWLFRIATNACIDHMRKKKLSGISIDVDVMLIQKGMVPKALSDDENPEQKMLKKQRKVLLHKNLDKINPLYGRVIKLQYIQEYSLKEIGEILQLPIGTIKVQLFRGKKLLREALKKEMEMV